ncbi:MAG: sigma-70 family RNA polymerase sigma factor, partial [Flammeovirgaceae bacterium]|nr:sigma-70 family RNA polymerase sigma factor [Flammeovirgaceae bacterium]MDW8289048.1 sigma-70 family RNA polymerase sigma factor [Flammeovirgaceae bacterium]
MTHHSLEDTLILEKFKEEATKSWAFRQLVEKYKERVYWHIRKMVISHDDADDLTQEVFLVIWNKLHTFQGESQLFTWIYRIATNECLNFLNKKKKRFFLPIHDITQELTEKLHQERYIEGEEIQLKL